MFYLFVTFLSAFSKFVNYLGDSSCFGHWYRNVERRLVFLLLLDRRTKLWFLINCTVFYCGEDVQDMTDFEDSQTQSLLIVKKLKLSELKISVVDSIMGLVFQHFKGNGYTFFKNVFASSVNMFSLKRKEFASWGDNSFLLE